MWSKGIYFSRKKAEWLRSRRNSFFISIFFTIVIFVSIVAMLSTYMGQTQEYSPVTGKCLSCHNDTGYPDDTNLDGVVAPYKRPHNNNVMCESCHKTNPHVLVFIQPSGTYGSRATAASCPECHQTGIPSGVNPNFTKAFLIPGELRHSSDPSNGSVWGSYWTNTTPRTACIFCHDNTLHSITPMGRILEWFPDYIINGSIGNNFTCSGCHYKASPTYSLMRSSFESAGLQIPPEITNGSNWNGTFTKYFNHSIKGFTDNVCKQCHGSSLAANATLGEFVHNVLAADMNACTSCHSVTGGAPIVGTDDLGTHINLNTTDGGASNLTSADCKTCHFDNPHEGTSPANTYLCADCHTASGTGPKKPVSSKIFIDKNHGEAACIDCHIADEKYHQGNPRGSVANPIYVNRYNTSNVRATDCADCHYAANLDDAPFYAPAGGSHIISNGIACSSSCHGSGTMIQTIHKVFGLYLTSSRPKVTLPTLSSSIVIPGTDVDVTARVDYTGIYAVVDGAQYRIMSGATEVRSWTPMSALDGNFNGSSEVATAIINTNIPPGNYTIEVRGMAGGPAQNASIRYYPINGDVSATNSTKLTIQAHMGYINGTVRSGSSLVSGAMVSVTGASSITYNGHYSLMVAEGDYTVTASKRPEYEDSIATGVIVTPNNTTTRDFVLIQKPTGMITGVVTNATG
jgi:hypothetical protein